MSVLLASSARVFCTSKIIRGRRAPLEFHPHVRSRDDGAPPDVVNQLLTRWPDFAFRFAED